MVAHQGLIEAKKIQKVWQKWYLFQLKGLYNFFNAVIDQSASPHLTGK